MVAFLQIGDGMKNSKVYEVSEHEKQVVSKNGRVLRLIKYNGVTKLISEWSDLTGIPHTTLQARLKRVGPNFSLDDVFKKK